MARVSNADTQVIEAQLGCPPGKGRLAGITVSSGEGGNRNLVRQWLIAQGLPSKVVRAMRTSTLGECYNNLEAYLKDGLPQDDGPTPAIEQAIEPHEPLPVAPLDEARVIDLIRQHAPRPDEQVIERVIRATVREEIDALLGVLAEHGITIALEGLED